MNGKKVLRSSRTTFILMMAVLLCLQPSMIPGKILKVYSYFSFFTNYFTLYGVLCELRLQITLIPWIIYVNCIRVISRHGDQFLWAVTLVKQGNWAHLMLVLFLHVHLCITNLDVLVSYNLLLNLITVSCRRNSLYVYYRNDRFIIGYKVATW